MRPDRPRSASGSGRRRSRTYAPSHSAVSFAPSTATVMPQTGSTASAGAAPGGSLACAATRRAPARIATAISSCVDGPRSRPAGLRTRASASSRDALRPQPPTAPRPPAARSRPGRRTPAPPRARPPARPRRRGPSWRPRRRPRPSRDSRSRASRPRARAPQRARRGALADDGEQRRGQLRLDQHLHDALGGARCSRRRRRPDRPRRARRGGRSARAAGRRPPERAAPRAPRSAPSTRRRPSPSAGRPA